MITEFDGKMNEISKIIHDVDERVCKLKKYRSKLYDQYCFLRYKRVKKYGRDILTFDFVSTGKFDKVDKIEMDNKNLDDSDLNYVDIKGTKDESDNEIEEFEDDEINEIY